MDLTPDFAVLPTNGAENLEKSLSVRYYRGMNSHVRELVEKAAAGKLSKAEARQAVVDARRELMVDHRVLLRDLNATIAGRGRMVDHQVFLRDLSAIITAEAALRRRAEPIETYRGVEIYAITLGIRVMTGADTAGRARFKCIVRAVIFIDNSCDGIRRMIDEALEASP
jgi:hypothetical protein